MTVRADSVVDILSIDVAAGARRVKELFSSKTARAIACMAIWSTTGCTTDPAIPTVTLVPTQVSCINGEPPEKPQTVPEAELLAMSDYAATLTTYTERLLLKAWAEKAEALLQACR